MVSVSPKPAEELDVTEATFSFVAEALIPRVAVASFKKKRRMEKRRRTMHRKIGTQQLIPILYSNVTKNVLAAYALYRFIQA